MYRDISVKAERIVKKYNERDPFRLCDDMDIILLFQPLGRGGNAVKGFYFENRRIRTITVNSDLPTAVQRIIAAHELGHAVLHRTSEIHAFHEIGLLDDSSQLEKEANLFAAELLLSDDEALEAIGGGNTFFSAAAVLRVPPELLDFKLRMMRYKGYKISPAPIASGNGFLKNIDTKFMESGE